ncbi:MAG: hypothetical protein V7L29_31150 [Nostoc sp.]|uniref:hypothetical protein n=1 Tax=Nostoc sp. TaxID=1180 RepID=UPI002FF4D69D
MKIANVKIKAWETLKITFSTSREKPDRRTGASQETSRFHLNNAIMVLYSQTKSPWSIPGVSILIP